MNVFTRLLIAASCVTSFHFAHVQSEEQDLSGLSKYLPLVGLMIGGALAGIVFACRWMSVSSIVTGVLLTISWICFSGGIHLDGLMDTADGVFSHRSPERMLEIMQDSRVGNFGVITGVLAIIVKAAALITANFDGLLISVLLVPVWARWTETLAIGAFPYAKPQGMGKIWHDTTRCPRDIIVAAIVPLLVTAAVCSHFDWHTALTISAAAILCGVTAAIRLSSILRGLTGDTYGAVVELSEAGALLCAALLLPQWRI